MEMSLQTNIVRNKCFISSRILLSFINIRDELKFWLQKKLNNNGKTSALSPLSNTFDDDNLHFSTEENKSFISIWFDRTKSNWCCIIDCSTNIIWFSSSKRRDSLVLVSSERHWMRTHKKVQRWRHWPLTSYVLNACMRAVDQTTSHWVWLIDLKRNLFCHSFHIKIAQNAEKNASIDHIAIVLTTDAKKVRTKEKIERTKKMRKEWAIRNLFAHFFHSIWYCHCLWVSIVAHAISLFTHLKIY